MDPARAMVNEVIQTAIQSTLGDKARTGHFTDVELEEAVKAAYSAIASGSTELRSHGLYYGAEALVENALDELLEYPTSSQGQG